MLDYIEPSDPNNSYLVMKIHDEYEMFSDGGGDPMPKGSTLTTEDDDVIMFWVMGGATE